MKQKESEIKKEILKALKLCGFFAFPVRTTGIKKPDGQWIPNKQQVGVSDILGILPGGIFLAIEVKTDKGVLSHNQSTFISEVRQYGGLAFVARSPKDAITDLMNYLQNTIYKDYCVKLDNILKQL